MEDVKTGLTGAFGGLRRRVVLGGVKYFGLIAFTGVSGTDKERVVRGGVEKLMLKNESYR
jgi:hypothetical protein